MAVLNVKGFIMGFIGALIGLTFALALLPTINDLVTNASSSIGGAGGVILGLTSLIVVLGVITYVIDSFLG